MGKAAATRMHILEKAFALIYARGYQAASIEVILAETGLTKGAFFYHFQSKEDMAIAIIEELLKPTMQEHYIAPLLSADDPAEAIYRMIHFLLMEHPFLQVEYGCPASNLTQEMAPWNREFTKVLAELVTQQQQAMKDCITRGKKAGLIRKAVNAEQVALFVTSGYWGIRNFGKLYGSKDCYRPFLKELKSYLESLK